jgi:hypothetical protein
MHSIKPEKADYPLSRIVTFAKEQPEYQQLHVLKYAGTEGIVVACFGMTWKERWRLFWTGKIWVGIMSFNKPLQPIQLSTQEIKYNAPDLVNIDKGVPFKHV